MRHVRREICLYNSTRNYKTDITDTRISGTSADKAMSIAVARPNISTVAPSISVARLRLNLYSQGGESRGYRIINVEVTKELLVLTIM